MTQKRTVKLERTAVVITALPVEISAVKKHLNDCRQVTHKQGTVYEVGFHESTTVRWRVCAAEVGSGNPATAAATERAISQFKPAYVFFVGVAGGVKDVDLGDVVVASKVCRYESGADGKEFFVRPDSHEPLYAMRERARALVRRLNESRGAGAARHFLGAVAAGEKVVKSHESATARFLATNYNDVLAVEMEGAGFFEAAHANGEVPALLIRGVSDLLDGKEQADRAGEQARAAGTAASFLIAFLDDLAAGQLPGVPEYVPLGGQPMSTAYEMLRSTITLAMLDPMGHRVRYTKRSDQRVLVSKVRSCADDMHTDGRIEEVRGQPFEAEYVVVQGNRYLVLSRHPDELTSGEVVTREITSEWVDSFRNEQEYFDFEPPFAVEWQELELHFPPTRHCKEVAVFSAASKQPIENDIEVIRDELDDHAQRVVVRLMQPQQHGEPSLRVQWQW